MPLLVDMLHLSGATPSGFGVYARNILRHVPWPAETRFVVGTGAAAEPALEGRTVTVSAPERPAGRLLWEMLHLNRCLRRERATLYFAPTPETVPTIRVPYVVVVHDLIPLLQGEYQSRKLRLFYRYVLPRVCRRAAAVITVSECTRQDLCRAYGVPESRVHAIPNGCDTAHFHPRPEAEVEAWKAGRGLERYVLYVGRLTVAKNIPRLVEAFLDIAGRVPHTLVLAGKDEQNLRGPLTAQAEARGLEHRVRFLDFLPHGELPLAYQGADAFVFPSLYEGFGLPPLEAMACGTPVLVADRGSLPEVVGDAGLYADPLSVADLAARMEALLGSADLRAEYAARGLARAATFTWEETGRRTRAVLDALL